MTEVATATHHRAPPAPGGLTHRQILTIMSGLMLGMFLAALDQTIVATAIRTIADDLHGLSVQAWATTAYLITSTITTPLYGKLSDLYGRKKFFLTAITLFLIGSALSGASQSMYQLAGFRALQGLGAGGLFSLALAIMGDIVPPRERARYQGYFLAVFGTSSVLGPVIGGFLAGRGHILSVTGWRWVFLVNVPIGLVALVVVSKVLNLPHRRRDHRIDWLGAVALTFGIVPLLVVAEQGRTWGWTSGRAVVSYAIGAVGLVAFYLAERRIGDDALIPLRFFRNSVFAVTSMINLVVGMGMFGGIVSLPLYLQIVKGATPTKAGLLLLPLTGGIMTASVFSGQLISRTGRYKPYPILGAGLMVIGLWMFHTVGASTPLWQTSIIMAVFGFGLGNLMQPIILAVQNAVPPQDMGMATSTATFFRQMGGTLGTAVFLSVLFGTVGDKIATAFRAIAPTTAFQQALHDPAVLANPANRPVVAAIAHAQAGGGAGLTSGTGALSDSSFIQLLDPRLARPFLVGFSNAMDLVFLVGTGVMVVGLVLVLFLKEIPLRTQSGIELQRAEALAASQPTDVLPSGDALDSVSADGQPPASPDGVAVAPARGRHRHRA